MILQIVKSFGDIDIYHKMGIFEDNGPILKYIELYDGTRFFHIETGYRVGEIVNLKIR